MRSSQVLAHRVSPSTSKRGIRTTCASQTLQPKERRRNRPPGPGYNGSTANATMEVNASTRRRSTATGQICAPLPALSLGESRSIGPRTIFSRRTPPRGNSCRCYRSGRDPRAVSRHWGEGSVEDVTGERPFSVTTRCQARTRNSDDHAARFRPGNRGVRS